MSVSFYYEFMHMLKFLGVPQFTFKVFLHKGLCTEVLLLCLNYQLD